MALSAQNRLCCTFKKYYDNEINIKDENVTCWETGNKQNDIIIITNSSIWSFVTLSYKFNVIFSVYFYFGIF